MLRAKRINGTLRDARFRARFLSSNWAVDEARKTASAAGRPLLIRRLFGILCAGSGCAS